MLKRAPSILAATAVAGLALAPSASATDMTPLVTCVETTSTGAKIAHFGYRNNSPSPVTRTVATALPENPKIAWLNMIYDGPANNWATVDNATIDRGQPTQFLPGQHDDVFTVPMSGPVLTWALVGRWATASASSPASQTCNPKTASFIAASRPSSSRQESTTRPRR